MFGNTHNAFPFRYDFNSTLLKRIDTTIRHSFADLVRIQLRYRSAIPSENCRVSFKEFPLKGTLFLQRVYKNLTKTNDEKTLVAKSGNTCQKLVSPVSPLNFYNMTGLWMISDIGLLVATVVLFVELLIVQQ